MDEKSGGPKTNEEIIEELTRDLESCCSRVGGECPESEDDVARSENVLGDETDESSGVDDGKRAAERPEDFVDEEALKDRETTLSESEREALRDEAERCKETGNELFRSENYSQAILAYTRGIRACPLAYPNERSVLYSNRAAAKSRCSDRDGAIADCSRAVELNPAYTKAYARRGRLYEETEKLDEALEDFRKALSLDPGHEEANRAVLRLPPLIRERNERLKAEMLGKLKDLGNMVLKPFGLSTSNFEVQQDPNSGGYSVKFHQNPS